MNTNSFVLTGNSPALPVSIPLWKLVSAGAVVGPVAAVLVFRDDCSGAWAVNQLALLTGSVLAGAFVSLMCCWVVKVDVYKRSGKSLALGILGALGVLSGAVILKLTLKLFGAPPALTADIALFVAILGFWNSFALMYANLRQRELRTLAVQSRIRGLEAQIRPHFFFNTLNTVSAFIPDQPEAAQAVLRRLATILRGTLSSSERAIVTLEQELELTREYLEIEKARFGARIRWTLPGAGETAGLEIPALTLQPLVENAVRHGVSRLPEGGEIRVELRRMPDGFELRVANPVEEVRDIELSRLLKPEHSLQLVADRLRLIYKGRSTLTVETSGEFVMILWIPKDL